MHCLYVITDTDRHVTEPVILQ